MQVSMSCISGQARITVSACRCSDNHLGKADVQVQQIVLYRDDYMKTTAFFAVAVTAGPESKFITPGPPIHFYFHVPLTPDDLSREVPKTICQYDIATGANRSTRQTTGSWETTFDPHSFDWSGSLFSHHAARLFSGHLTIFYSFLDYSSRSELVVPEKWRL
jgi:hypothetical protein